jgi:hypothetical protein
MHWPTLADDFSSHSTLAFAPFQSLLSRCAPCVASKSRVLTLLRTLFLSLRSFRRPPRLFSIACGLFVQNTGGVGTSATSSRSPRLPVPAAGSLRYRLPFFVTPLFSWPYKLLFPQPLSFAKHLRCPPGVGSALLSELSPPFSTAVINFAAAGNFLLPQARVIVLTFRGDYVR